MPSPRSLQPYLLFCALILCWFPRQSFAEYDQRIPAQVCTFTSDTGDCFEIQDKTYRVSKEVATLGDLYHFCVGLDSTLNIIKPMSVVVSMDVSCSMCWCGDQDKPTIKNDTDDVRIEAMYALLDSLNRRSPMSRMGVIRFFNNITGRFSPATVGEHLNDLVWEVYKGSCESTGDSRYSAPSHHPSLRKSRAVQNALKASWTDQGLGLQEALELVNANNTNADGDTLARHVILLTDGGWVDESGKPYKPASQVLDWYAGNYPNLPLPKIHTVLLMRNPSIAGGGDTTNIAQIASASGGQYIPDASPATITRKLLSILDSIAVEVPEVLEGVKFTDIATGATANGTPQKYAGSEYDYQVVLPSQLSLSFGLNEFEVRKTVSGNVYTDTLRIRREASHIDNPDIGSWKQTCGIDTMHLDVLGTPTVVDESSTIGITAKVKPEEANQFAPDDVTLRAFTAFPSDAPGTLALYHLEGNVRDAAGENNGSGSPAFSTREFAFGEQSLNGGNSFQIDLPSGLDGDFTVEAWVKPDYTGSATIIDGGGLSFGISDAGRIYVGGWKSSSTVDRNVWQHIALARQGAQLTVYVNGLPMGNPSTSLGTLSGTATVGPVSNNGYLDELRISSTVHTEQVAGHTMLKIPTTALSWTVAGSTTNGISATVPKDLWTGGTAGQVQFWIGSSTHAQVIVNMLHTTTGQLWSKVSNPLLIYVKYDALYVESDPTGQQSPRKPQPVDTVYITQFETQKNAYAVIRDSRGWFVEASNPTTWNSSNESAVTVANGVQTKGEGLFNKRADDDQSTVRATNSTHDLSGSTVVKVLGYYWLELKIVGGSTGQRDIDSLTMHTGQDTVLRVLGLRSDDTTWEEASGDWSIVAVAPADQSLHPPDGSNSWDISPASTDTGTGWIKVVGGDPARTKSDSIWYDIDVQPPTNISIEVITPDSQRVAGDTIAAVVRIDNLDGPVPGQWCDTTAYADALTAGNNRPSPVVVVDGRESELGTGGGLSDGTDQCFGGGVDTVRFVLYNAPYGNDSLHQLSVSMNGLTGSAQPFRLYPGPLAQIELQDYSGGDIGDSVRIAYPDGAVVVYARGYDRFGNFRGDTECDWSVDGTLHRVGNAIGAYRVYYSASEVKDDESGFLTAVPSDTSVSNVSDRLHIRIKGPAVTVSQAITRDLDGDGYLDAIEIHFTEAVSVPSEYDYKNSITVEYSVVNWEADSLVGRDGSVDSVFTLYLAEDSSSKVPQTSWRPDFELTGLAGVSDVPSGTLECVDGAGPVVWKVYKSIRDPNDRTQDRIKVILSEKALAGDGKSINVQELPADLFRVFEPDGSGAYDTLHTMLDSIPNLVSVTGDSVIEFSMANGKDLLTRQYLNIKPSAGVTDRSSGTNQVHTDNRKVRVELVGPPPNVLVPFPNPTRPTFRRQAPGVLPARHVPNARRWVLEDQSAVVLTFPFTLPDSPGEQGVSCYMKVYDGVGNLVQSAVDDDLVASLPGDAGSVYNVDLYWNGSNSSGMPVAPGVYRVVVYVDYESPDYEDARLYTNVGIGK